MEIGEVRKKLNMLKVHVDHMEKWVKQASDMIYDLEEKIMDEEDNKLFYKRNEEAAKIEYLKNAASQIYGIISRPPRHLNDFAYTSRHRSEYDTRAAEILSTLN